MMKTLCYLQVVVLMALLSRGTTTCPHGCQCTRKGDIITAMHCAYRDTFPEDETIFNLKSLNMSRNTLSSIHGNTFTKTTTLQQLDLSGNVISSVEDGVFREEIFQELISLNFSNNRLKKLPRNLTSNLEELKINSNKVETLYLSELNHLGKLRSLYIDNNKISDISVDQKEAVSSGSSEKVMKNLEILSLSNNRLGAVDKRIWKLMPQLQYLVLANNHIKTVKSDSFKGLRFLRYLDLSGNRIKSVLPKAVHHFSDLKFLSFADNLIETFPEELPMVEWFDISNNRIRHIPEGKKSALYPQEVFLIGRNPFHCSCQLLWVKELYDTREYQLKFIQVDGERFTPACSTPEHLAGDTWDVLADETFGCTTGHQESPKEAEDEKLVWNLKDLAVKILEVGDTYLRVEWDSVNIKVQAEEKHVIIFHTHPFGKKYLRKSVSVHPQIGRYVLKALNPNTAYIVCMSIMVNSPADPVNVVSSGECLEIITREMINPEQSWIMFLTRNPTFYLIILSVSGCFFYFCRL